MQSPARKEGIRAQTARGSGEVTDPGEAAGGGVERAIAMVSLRRTVSTLPIVLFDAPSQCLCGGCLLVRGLAASCMC